jgi:hypothetical protein
MASEMRGILKKRDENRVVDSEPEPAAEVKNVSFSDIYMYHVSYDYDKKLLAPTRELIKQCDKCHRIVNLDRDLYKSTLMPVDNESKGNTRFHLDLFKEAKEEEYNDLISQLNLKIKCRKHDTRLDYRQLL